MARIEFKNFSLKFWGQENFILKDINLKFDTSERILLLSPSGRGKSTLLLCLMGVIQRNELGEASGEILIGGREAGEMTPLEIAEKFGIVFQEPESQFCLLYPDEEVAFALENLKHSQSEMRKRVKEALERVGMYSKREHLLSSLSGGEQQRVAIASTIAMGSEMLLLDEPTANLDASGRREVCSLVSSLDKGFLLVEHNLDEWMDEVDRVVVLGKEGILKDAPRGEFLSEGMELLEKLGIWRPGEKWNEGVKSKGSRGAELLKIDELNFSYGDKPVLEEFSMELREGEIVALLGRNGAGKSTLSRIAGRIEEKWQGDVTYCGRKVGSISRGEYYRETAYVFQNPEHQFIRDTVRGEVELALKNFNSTEGVEGVLRRYGLEGVELENPFTLSGGEKRRLSVAVMLSEDHRVLILDEPTFGLDYRNARELMERVAQLAEGGMGVILISHDMELVERYAHRAVVIDDGRKIYDGSPENLWSNDEVVKRGRLEVPGNIRVKAVREREVAAG